MKSVAQVVTDRPERYAKQLASHFSRKCEVLDTPEGPVIVLAGGRCLLAARDDILVLSAEGPAAEVLARVQDVVGRHLERFGEKDGLAVVWSEAMTADVPEM